jgi:hypothetical protein
MAILDFIKGLFRKEEVLAKKSVQKLMTLAPEERGSGIGDFLYQFCFDNAAKFVYEEMHRKSSPFVKLSRDHFFSEILIMNFWIVDKVFKKHMPFLAAEFHHRYFGTLPDAADGMAKRFKIYYDDWDDYTGHQDLFGMKAGELIFDSNSDFPVPEVSFWIISYADEAIKSLKKIRKAYREANLL